MTVSSITSSSSSPPGLLQHQSRIWQCINAEADTKPGTWNDAIGLVDVVGIDIWHDEKTQREPRLEVHDLGQDNIEPWIQQPRSTVSAGGETLHGKILVGTETPGASYMRPPDDEDAVRFTRAILCRHFDFPPEALAWISSAEAQYLDGIAGLRPGTVCDVLAARPVRFADVIDSKTGFRCAMITFHSGMRPGDRTKLLEDIATLHHLSRETAFVSCVVAINLVGIQVSDHQDTLNKGVDMIKQLSKGQLQPEFHSITQLLANKVQYAELDIKNVLKMSKKWMQQLRRRPKQLTDDEWKNMKDRRQELLDGFRFSEQMLHVIPDKGRAMQQLADQQLTAYLSSLAREQQQTGLAIAEGQAELARLSREDQKMSLQLAEATKIIAEETRRDSSSMKTLAVVTMLYLPATSISSILAMPLFDWRGGDGAVVNSMVWVYFVLAVPLTAITVGTWYVWQRRKTKEEALRRMLKA